MACGGPSNSRWICIMFGAGRIPSTAGLRCKPPATDFCRFTGAQEAEIAHRNAGRERHRRPWRHARILSREFLSPTSNLRALKQGEIPGKLPFVLAILVEITVLPPIDPALLRCLIRSRTEHLHLDNSLLFEQNILCSNAGNCCIYSSETNILSKFN